MTLPERILSHVAAGAGLVIAVATWATYSIVFEAAKRGDLKHLETYVAERSRKEEAVFEQVGVNLRLVRGQFLKRMQSPVPRNYQEKWDARFKLYPDGAWRSREEFSDGRRYATLWAHKNVVLTPEWQTRILRAQDICDELLPGWADAFPSVYFVFPGWANIGFDPRLPTWVWDTPADYEAGGLEWFQMALPDPAPKRDGLSWTGVIEEPTTKAPIVSIYLPILRNGGEFLGSIGHDLFVDRLMDEASRSRLPGATHVVFRGDGRLVAHPGKREAILQSKGQIRMQDCGEPSLDSLYRLVLACGDRISTGYDEKSGNYFCVARLAGPEWYFLTILSSEQLRRQAFESAQWVLWSGLGSLAVVLSLLATTLRRHMAQPLAELGSATRRMSAGEMSVRVTSGRQDELGSLARAFNEMATQVEIRDAKYRQLNQELEERVEGRTLELQEANRRLDEGREEALRLLAKERELSELKSNFVALVSHEFRTPLEIILSSADNLDRYADRLTVEKKQQLLQTIRRSVRRMAGMMEEVLVLGRLESDRMSFNPSTFDLRALCQRLCDETDAATGHRCPIRTTHTTEPSFVRGDESLLRHILSNLLSNAVKYSEAGKQVDLVCTQEGILGVIQVVDRGCGIPRTDQPRLFQAFRRGSNVQQVPGTGLGLLIVRRCVELHGGTMDFESVEGQGTTFTVRLPLYEPTAESEEKT